MNYYSKNEIEGIVPTTLLDRPKCKEGTKTWWRWYYGLSDNDKNVLADLEAN